MSDRIEYGNLKVSKELDNFLRKEVVPEIDVDPENFWKSFEKVLEPSSWAAPFDGPKELIP